MKNKIKISIVVPVYNVEPFIKQCLDSLINQTLKEIEIILIDDCSTDISGTLCDEYATKDNRIIVIHNEKNIRQGLSRNKGIEIAKGEYIGFMDPDDWVSLDFYEKLYNSAIKNESDIVKTERKIIFPDGTGEIQTDLNKEIKKGLKKRAPIFLSFTYEHQSAIFKRKIIIKENIRYPNIRNGEDDVFLLRITYYAKSISVISGTYYYYRQHPNSTISVREKPYYDSILQYFKLYLDFINTHKMEKNHYDIVFLRGLNSLKNRYKEMDAAKEMSDFRKEYVKEALKLIIEYKYDTGYLIESLFNGFDSEKKIQLLEKKNQLLINGNAFRIGKVITWLPSKIKKLLN